MHYFKPKNIKLWPNLNLLNWFWNVKETIRDTYDDSEVEDEMLPFTLLRRMDCFLRPVRVEIESEKCKYEVKMREAVFHLGKIVEKNIVSKK